MGLAFRRIAGAQVGEVGDRGRRRLRARQGLIRRSLGRLELEYAAELDLADGERIAGCEMQIDSQSVSRNHAVLLKGTRELIVEDLNSTNGVLVNGRKVSRQLLNDGDVLTIGETQFRCVLKFNSRPADPAAPSVSELRPADAAKSAPPEAAARTAGLDAAQPPGTAPAGIPQKGAAAAGPAQTGAAAIDPAAADN